MPSDAITFLGASSVAGAKRFTPEGTTPYACGAGPFAILRIPITSLADAAQYIGNCPGNAFVIRGRAIGDPAQIPWRLYRAKPDRAPTIEAEAHHLLPIDIDRDGDGRDGRDLEANARAYRDLLPLEFRSAACFAQATSSAGVKPGTRMRLWFWCDRALTDDECAAWLHEYDTAIYRPAQPIYCAAPTFDRVADPFEGRPRSVMLEGAPAVACPTVIPDAPARPRAVGTGATPTEGRNTYLTSLAGTMRRRGVSEGGILGCLLAENDLFPEPLDDEEVEAIARSIAQYDPSAPAILAVTRPVTEGTRADAERTLRKVQDRVRDDPASWRKHIEAIGPALHIGAITPGIVQTRLASALSEVAAVMPEDLRAAIDTVAVENPAIASVQEAWLAPHGPILSKDGDALVPCAHNLSLVLRHAPELQGVCWDPRLSLVRVWSAPWPRPGRDAGTPWDMADESELRAYLCRFGWIKPPGELFAAVLAASRYRELDWWNSTLEHCSAQWDGENRIRDTDMVARILGCEDTPQHREFFRKWLISSVARSFSPGSKVDTALVLLSAQGASKGRLFAALLGVGDGAIVPSAMYYAALTERSRDLSDRDVLAKLSGRVIIEIAENAAISAREESSVKAFLTERADSYRAPYARSIEMHPRTCVFAITTNEDEFLTDTTGNRRYKVIRCGLVDIDLVRASLVQLWGEAVHAYRAGEAYHYADEGDENDAYMVDDPWVDDLRAAIAHAPPNVGLRDDGRLVGLRARDALVLLDVPSSARTQAVARRVGKCLRALGWVRQNRRHGTEQIKAFWR